MARPGELGSGAVTYHPDRPIIHFGTPTPVNADAGENPCIIPGSD